ncbi:phosphatase PAP2 family protein [Hymenobacter sp. DG01]|uniref:phosphatase PAP2 family protein n=1 Tax=Hymenobacter sp. DG01 TaxID=2584940 RepID=UPI00111E33A9|nr:phosphatase PAP2 family protein [Hymenobacter sp. DG01]
MRKLLLFLLLGYGASPIARAQAPVVSPDSLHPAGPAARQRSGWRPQVWRVGVPLALVGLGYVSTNENVLDEMKEEVHEETREHFPHFATSLDNYSRHLPAAAAYGLFAVGLRGERGVGAFTVCYGLSHALSTGAVTQLKHLSHARRPDNPADFSSFPSAHTAEAFLTATLLYEQFGREYPWLSVGGYSVAAATGAMRMLNNRHWVTDVLAGAGVGFLSAEAVWRLYPAAAHLLPGRLGQKLLLLPAYAPGGAIGLCVVVR